MPVPASFKDAFDAAFADICGGVDVYYAGKSFLCTAVVKWVEEEGLRLDTASGGELAVAARAGIAGERVALHGNNKSDAEITRALDMGLGRIVVDSLAELVRVGAIAQARGEQAKVMLRLTPGVHAHTHEFIATAHEDQKFGLSMAADTTEQAGLSAAEEAVAAAAAHPGIDLLGLHCHIGSQIFEPDGFAVAAEKLLRFLAAMQDKYGIVMPELDLGGGYGIAYTAVDTPRPAGGDRGGDGRRRAFHLRRAGHHGAADLHRTGPGDRGQHHLHAVRGGHPQDRPRRRARRQLTPETLRIRAGMFRWTAA